MPQNTVRLHRLLRAKPECIYPPFSTPLPWSSGFLPTDLPVRFGGERAIPTVYHHAATCCQPNGCSGLARWS